MMNATTNTTPGEGSTDFHEIAARYIGLGVSAVAVVANILVLIGLGKVKSKWNPHLLLVVNLTIADLTIASLLIINRLDHLVLNDWIYKVGSKTGCFRSLVYGKGVWAAAYLTLLVIGFDHYVAILNPLHYRRLITRRRIMITIAGIWIVSALLHFSQHFLALGYQASGEKLKTKPYCKVFKAIKKKVTLNEYIYVGMVALGLIFMTYAYIRIFIEVKKCLAYSPNLSTIDRDKMKKNWYSALTSLLILVTFLVCYLPYCISKTTNHVTSLRHLPWFHDVHEYLSNLRVVNSLCDPVIYALRLSTVKQGLALAFRGCGCLKSLPDRSIPMTKLRNGSWPGSSSCKTEMTDVSNTKSGT